MDGELKFLFLLMMISMAGSRVIAPRLELTMLIAMSMPKYCKGTISEKTSTKKPAETDITLMIIAFPLIIRVSLMDFSNNPVLV